MKFMLALITMVAAVAALAPASVAQQDLYFNWIGVIDNGEGDGIHGPHGNLHIDVWDASGNKIVDNNILVGPSRREYLDGDQGFYGFYIGTVSWHNAALRIRIWESDPGPFRGHDVLFDQWIAGPGLYYSRYAAPADAVRNAHLRGASSWVEPIWGALRRGVPKVFVEIR